MAMLTGEVVGRGFARTAQGLAVIYKMVLPDRNTVNTGLVFPAEIVRWTATAARFREMANRYQLNPEVARRAEFAGQALGLAASNVAQGVGNVMALQAQDGRNLAVVTYTPLSATEISLNLLAVDPLNLAGSPGNQQLRGLGTALVAGVSRKAIRVGATTMYLHPLDAEAERFWKGRGFMPCGRGGLLCVRGKPGIEGLMDGCEVRPGCADSGDCLICGVGALYREPALT